MPGIAGIIDKGKAKKNMTKVQLMLECMKHEPFYTQSTYFNEQLGFYAGWACHGNSFAECMPIFNERKDLTFLFSGEPFENDVLTSDLKLRKHEFNSSDASYIIYLYEEEGENFIRRLNGWFSGIIIDLRKQEVVLFNDRYSMHRIYYYEDNDIFYFSSEAKAILKVCPELRKMDPSAAGEFFACGCTLENKSLFSKINVLPGGSAWTFHKDGRIEKKSYFDFKQWEEQETLEKEVFYKKFNEVIHEILPKYFRSKDRVAMSLTGGLDTRMIMATANPEPETLPCYTFGGMFRDCYDTQVARKIALTCQQPYSIIKLGSDFLRDFPKHAEKTIYITDGCVDVSVSHEIYLNSLARQIAPVRLTGNYGSEVLRSVNYIKAMPPVDGLIHHDFFSYIQNAMSKFQVSTTGHKLTYAVTKLIPWHLYGRLSAAQSQLTVRTPYMDNALIRLFYQAPESVRKCNDISCRLIREGNSDLAAIMTDRGVPIGASTTQSKIIRFYREALFKAEYLYNEGMPDWIARADSTMRSMHPEKVILGHHKIEHYRHWFRTELADYMRDIIMDDRTLMRPYWNRKFLTDMVDDHIKGKRNHIRAINIVLAVELIHRTLLESS
jgi:asparagine synthase (glutamine-hydrolysing)